ncbi:MAG: hypothetical protein ABUT20_66675 [Bacteroidota bacterium]
MIATAIKPNNSALKAVETLSGYSALGVNKVSTIKKVIELTTDKESADNTSELVAFVLEIKEALPTKFGEGEAALITKSIETINSILTTVNSALNVIDNVFDGEFYEPTEIKIDDPNMKKLLCNLKEAKEVCQYVSDYLTLSLEILESKKEINKNPLIFTVELLAEKLNAA